MNRKYWTYGVMIGIVTGLIVAFVMTFLDWRLNPGSVFYNTHGTDWTVVVETAFSWFAPTSVVVSGSALLVFFVLVRLR